MNLLAGEGFGRSIGGSGLDLDPWAKKSTRVSKSSVRVAIALLDLLGGSDKVRRRLKSED